MPKDFWDEVARETFLYTTVKRAVDKRRSTQDQGRGDEGQDASPDASTPSGDRPAHPRRGGGLFVMTYLLGMCLNVTLAAFHISGHLPQVEGLHDWIIAGWVLAGIVVFVVTFLLSCEAGWKTHCFAGLTVVAVLLVGAMEGVLLGMGLIFLVSCWVSVPTVLPPRRK